MSKSAKLLDFSKLPKESWRPMEIDSHRIGDRTNERDIEKISAWIKTIKFPVWKSVRIRDYSMQGFGIMVKSDIVLELKLVPGDDIDLKISLVENRASEIYCTLQYLELRGKEARIGLKKSDIHDPSTKSPNPYPHGYYLNPKSPLRSRIANPFFFQEWAEAHLIGMGYGNILVYESTNSSLLLLPGEPIDIGLELPSLDQGQYCGIIQWSKNLGDEAILFAVKTQNISFELNNTLGEFFIREWDCKPAALSEFGFRFKRFKEQLEFSFLSNQKEYAQVLNLRRNAYVHAGKGEPDATPNEYISKFDNKSRILIAVHQDSVVASLTLNFAEDENSILRSEEAFPGTKFPISLPPKNKMIEAHSFCTHKDYRGGNLLQGMMEHGLRCLLLSDREWIITFVTDELWPLYRRMGCQKTGASAPIANLKNLHHHLILVHKNSVLFAQGVRIWDWNYFYGDLVIDIVQKKLIEFSYWRLFQIGFLRGIGKLTLLLSNAKMKNDFRQFVKLMNKTGE